MGISVEDDIIIVTDGTYSTKDICDALDNEYAQELTDNIYHIKKSIFIGNKDCTGEAELIDAGVVIKADGEYFQVHKGSKLQLGELRDNGTTVNGCTLIGKNLTKYYGFGGGADTDGNGRSTDISGDLYLYGCTIDMWTFWSWFRGEDQEVKIVDCIVNGYGRIQGETSIVRNITIEKSNGRYGVLSPKGRLAEYRNISVGSTDGTSEEAAIYWNPQLAPYMRIDGGVFSGYENLIYTEEAGDEKGYLEFVGSEILDGLQRYTKDDKSDVYVKYIYNPVLCDINGDVMDGLDIQVLDTEDNEIWSGTSDTDGKIYVELMTARQIGEDDIEYFTRYKMKGVIDDIDFEFCFEITSNIIDVNVVIPACVATSSGSEAVDYDRIQAMLDSCKDDVCECNSVSTDLLISKVNTISETQMELMLAVGSEVAETQTYVQSVDNGSMLV